MTTTDVQTDLFGGATPVDELALTPNQRALLAAERALGSPLDADEAGAILHERRGRHRSDERCQFCTQDGEEALARLREKMPPVETRGVDELVVTGSAAGRVGEDAAAAGTARVDPCASTSTGGYWTCPDCGRRCPEEHVFCRGCAGTRDPDPEPRPPARARNGDPVTSHAAARTVDTSGAAHFAVLRTFERFGPMHDRQLQERYPRFAVEHGLPRQTDSGLRTRRHELVETGQLEPSGKVALLDSGRRAVVWQIVAQAPADDPEPPR